MFKFSFLSKENIKDSSQSDEAFVLQSKNKVEDVKMIKLYKFNNDSIPNINNKNNKIDIEINSEK